MAEATKSCPSCAEQVLAVAKKCRHCGEFFDDGDKPSRVRSPYEPCPSCGKSVAEAVSFTWWGGLIGPKILTHVRCTSCSTTYNGKTGQSNTTGIIIYTVVLLVLFGAIGLVAAFAH
jgi:predicted RNA-binding Zn-ribbon protein involved in translation (DUF1610 family)